jgi:hypothetical protein
VRSGEADEVRRVSATLVLDRDGCVYRALRAAVGGGAVDVLRVATAYDAVLLLLVRVEVDTVIVDTTSVEAPPFLVQKARHPEIAAVRVILVDAETKDDVENLGVALAERIARVSASAS